MKILCHFLTAALLAASAPAAPVRVSLEPVTSDISARPFSLALLGVENGLKRPIAAAALTPVRGGPTMLVELPVPPGAAAHYRVALPAADVYQEYAVRLFDAYDDGRTEATPPNLLAQATVEIDWPLETVSAGTLIRPQACAAVAAPPPAWPPALRQQAMATLTGLVILLSLSSLISRRPVRVLAVLASAAAGGALLFWLAQSPAAAVAQTLASHLVQFNADGSTLRQTLLRLSARRTADFPLTLDHLRPVYPDRIAFEADRSLLRAGTARQKNPPPSLIRAAAGEVCIFVGPSSRGGSGAAAPPTITIDSGATDDTFALTASRAVPASFLVIADRFTPLPPLPAATPQTVKLSPSEPLRLLRQSPQKYGFDEQCLTVFDWWDEVHREVSKAYIVWTSVQDGDNCINAVEAR
jgi:hypothetical protein